MTAFVAINIDCLAHASVNLNVNSDLRVLSRFKGRFAFDVMFNSFTESF